jgi:hypothetical protein
MIHRIYPNASDKSIMDFQYCTFKEIANNPVNL